MQTLLFCNLFNILVFCRVKKEKKSFTTPADWRGQCCLFTLPLTPTASFKCRHRETVSLDTVMGYTPTHHNVFNVNFINKTREVKLLSWKRVVHLPVSAGQLGLVLTVQDQFIWLRRSAKRWLKEMWWWLSSYWSYWKLNAAKCKFNSRQLRVNVSESNLHYGNSIFDHNHVTGAWKFQWTHSLTRGSGGTNVSVYDLLAAFSSFSIQAVTKISKQHLKLHLG